MQVQEYHNWWEAKSARSLILNSSMVGHSMMEQTVHVNRQTPHTTIDMKIRLQLTNLDRTQDHMTDHMAEIPTPGEHYGDDSDVDCSLGRCVEHVDIRLITAYSLSRQM